MLCLLLLLLLLMVMTWLLIPSDHVSGVARGDSPRRQCCLAHFQQALETDRPLVDHLHVLVELQLIGAAGIVQTHHKEYVKDGALLQVRN